MIVSSWPGGVTSNIITKLVKGDAALSISYTAAISLLTIITLSIVIVLSMKYLMGSGAPLINLLSLDFTMFFITVIPVGLGGFIRKKIKIV